MKTANTTEVKSYKDITSVAIAAKYLGLDPNATPDVSMLPERIQPFTLGMPQRAIVVEALNKAFGLKEQKRWIPDYKNGKWDKYYPWGVPGEDDKVPSGFGFSSTYYGFSGANACVGSRLELRDPKLVNHMWEHFRQLLVDTMTIPPNEK